MSLLQELQRRARCVTAHHAACVQVKYTLQAAQYKSDFLPDEAADPEVSLTLPCLLVCALVAALGKQALGLLQASNAQSYLAEVCCRPTAPGLWCDRQEFQGT